MKFKRILSGTIAGTMLLSCNFVLAANAEDTSNIPQPVAQVTFDDGGAAYELFGGAALTDGRSGKALSLDGNSQYATVNSIGDALSSINGDFTISVWTNPQTLGSWARVYDFGNGSAGNYAFLTASNGANARFAFKDGSEQVVDAKGALTVGDWQNVVISRDGGITTFYINGRAVGSTDSITYNWQSVGKFNNYYLGKSQFDADAYYAGEIDDLAIYDCAATKDMLVELAAEKYVDENAENINKYNCQILDTKYYLNGERIFALGKNQTGELQAVTTIKNYTTEPVEMTVQTMRAKGTDTSVIGSEKISVASGETKEITYTENAEGYLENDRIYTTITDESTAQQYSTSEISITADDFINPVTAPADSNETTNGAHDPSIVQFPNDDTYYVYSSHHLIFTSKDLINWKKYDFTNKTVQQISPKTYNFITNNYTNTTCNGTYWAPDVIYVPRDSHPYWMYISVSCGLGGRNSAISLMKSDNPLFWADSSSDIIDAGVVYATKESNSYVTNAIDANIYFDSNSNKPYFVWGSFWGGIQSAEMNGSISEAPYARQFEYDGEQAFISAENGAAVIAASYNENGALTAAKIYNIAKGENSVAVDAKKGDKLFAWDNINSMQPVVEYSLTVTGDEGNKRTEYNGDGFLSAINYTSDSTILSTSASTKNSIFTQKNGVAGPEGAWMFEHNGYRYAFTSYGWLGSNYNTRVARSSLSEPFASSKLVDANGVDMSTEYSKGGLTKDKISGYKMAGSFRLGDGSDTMLENDSNDFYYPRSADDAHIYYGLGHNSAITADNGETFYVSHVRKDAVEGAAVLQTRKMLFTQDGWPVINPISYAGEKEQTLPKNMIAGTYDLASVGVTKMNGNEISNNWSNGHSGNRNYDLPVISSKVTLLPDGTMANGLGTWEFDGNYTVTLKFTANGDETKDEFYKSGDVMTMYALLSYDKDEEDYVLALTGTNQNHITQMARKSMTEEYYTTPKTITSSPISIAKSANGNPELGFDTDGNRMYGGDPAATVIGDTVYLIVGHDTASKEEYVMPDWVIYTSKNLTDWECKGTIMKATDISWRSNDTSAWASQMTEYNGKYYLYYCTWDKTSSGKQSIGVAVADTPEGPYTDIGHPLVAGTFTTPESSGWNDIDPTVLIDTDESGTEHRFLAWGNSKYYVCELNEDMVSVKDLDGDGAIVMHKDILERKIKSMPAGDQFTEAPWLYKRDGKYYLFYAQNWREEMAYAMMDSPLGRYDFKQIIMPPSATANTNHPSVIDFNGKTYFIYHNGALEHGSGFRRSVCIQELEFDENGYVYPLTELSVGLDGTANTLISSNGKYIGHDQFTNSRNDALYPLSVPVKAKDTEDGYNTAWEIKPAKSGTDLPDYENYISIQSVNKPGLYIAEKDGSIVLTQDADGKQGRYMTFKTVQGLDGKENTVSFESVNTPGKYLTVINNTIELSYASDKAAASFALGEVSPVAKNTIKVADIEPDPDPMAGIENDFNKEATATIMAMGDADQTSEDFAGVTLYIGSRAGDGNAKTSYWEITSGGTTGNALAMTSGKYVSANRGPRMKLTDGAIPNNYTLTGSVNIKLGTDNAKLFYNDSTGTQGDADITSYLSTAEYREFKVTITNNSETYTRTIYINGEQIAQDYVSTFPVLWGTPDNNTNAKVLFDDINIKTTTESGEAASPKPAEKPVPDAEYTFNDALTGLVSVNSKGAADNAPAEIATEPGKSGNENDKALSFTGENSGGVVLDKAPDGSSYTISFDVKLNAATQFTPFILLMNYDGSTALTDDTNARWVSIAPMGWQSTLDDGPMIWSRDVTYGNAWNDIYTTGNKTMSLNSWHNITVTANNTAGTIYVDGKQTAAGAVANIIDDTTKIFVGVNFWDTPLNGAIDNIRIYNKTLTAAQVALINE